MDLPWTRLSSGGTPRSAYVSGTAPVVLPEVARLLVVGAGARGGRAWGGRAGRAVGSRRGRGSPDRCRARGCWSPMRPGRRRRTCTCGRQGRRGERARGVAPAGAARTEGRMNGGRWPCRRCPTARGRGRRRRAGFRLGAVSVGGERPVAAAAATPADRPPGDDVPAGTRRPCRPPASLSGCPGVLSPPAGTVPLVSADWPNSA